MMTKIEWNEAYLIRLDGAKGRNFSSKIEAVYFPREGNMRHPDDILFPLQLYTHEIVDSSMS